MATSASRHTLAIIRTASTGYLPTTNRGGGGRVYIPRHSCFTVTFTECSLQRLHTRFNTRMLARTHAYTHCILHGTHSRHLPYSHHHSVAVTSILSKCTLNTHYTKHVCHSTPPPCPSQHTPFAVSPDSMTQSVPSRTALATSEVSARVGRGLLIMLSSIWGKQGGGARG